MPVRFDDERRLDRALAGGPVRVWPNGALGSSAFRPVKPSLAASSASSAARVPAVGLARGPCRAASLGRTETIPIPTRSRASTSHRP